MCLCPKKIPNQTKHWSPDNHPLYLLVPCGKCEECCKHNRDDWFVRCYYEWMNNRNGCTFFYTLTYNEERIPRYDGMKCFRKRDIQLFIKLLRKRLAVESLKLKYLVTSEYGEKYGRPHYHALFFVYGHISPWLFYRLVENCWCVVIRKGNSYEYKSRGFVKYGDNLGLVNQSAGIQYVTKYITKDVSYTSEHLDSVSNKMVRRYNTLLKWLSQRYETEYQFTFSYDSSDAIVRQSFDFGCSDAYKEEYRPFLNKVRREIFSRLPFHLQSSKLGISALDGHTSFEYTFDSLPVVTNRGTQYYKLPRYLKRRLWYEAVENETDFKRNRFILTPQGIEKYCHDLEKKIETSETNYQFLLKNFDEVGMEALTIINKSLEKYKLSFYSWIELYEYLNGFDLDLKVLSLYENLFRYRVCPFPFDLVEFTPDFIKRHYKDFIYTVVYEVGRYDYGSLNTQPKDWFESTAEHLFNYHPFFGIYEVALIIFESLSLCIRNQTQRVLNEAERNQRFLRQLFKETDPLSAPY